MMRRLLSSLLVLLLLSCSAQANFCFTFNTLEGIDSFGTAAFWEFAGGDVISLVRPQDPVEVRIACPEMPGASKIDCFPLGVNGTSLTITRDGVSYPVYTTEISQAYVQADPLSGWTYFYLGVPSAQISSAFIPETLWFYNAIRTPSIPTSINGLVTLDQTGMTDLAMGMRSTGVNYDYTALSVSLASCSPAPVAAPVAQPVPQPAPVAQPVPQPSPRAAPVAAPVYDDDEADEDDNECHVTRPVPTECPNRPGFHGRFCDCYVSPVLECVREKDSKHLRAYFGWTVRCENSTRMALPEVGYIHIPNGLRNSFHPAMYRDPPKVFCFRNGLRSFKKFHVDWTGDFNLVWKMGRPSTTTASNSLVQRCRDTGKRGAVETLTDVAARLNRELWPEIPHRVHVIQQDVETFTGVFPGETCPAVRISVTTSEPIKFRFTTGTDVFEGSTVVPAAGGLPAFQGDYQISPNNGMPFKVDAMRQSTASVGVSIDSRCIEITEIRTADATANLVSLFVIVLAAVAALLL